MLKVVAVASAILSVLDIVLHPKFEIGFNGVLLGAVAIASWIVDKLKQCVENVLGTAERRAVKGLAAERFAAGSAMHCSQAALEAAAAAGPQYASVAFPSPRFVSRESVHSMSFRVVIKRDLGPACEWRLVTWPPMVTAYTSVASLPFSKWLALPAGVCGCHVGRAAAPGCLESLRSDNPRGARRGRRAPQDATGSHLAGGPFRFTSVGASLVLSAGARPIGA